MPWRVVESLSALLQRISHANTHESIRSQGLDKYNHSNSQRCTSLGHRSQTPRETQKLYSLAPRVFVREVHKKGKSGDCQDHCASVTPRELHWRRAQGIAPRWRPRRPRDEGWPGEQSTLGDVGSVRVRQLSKLAWARWTPSLYGPVWYT